MSSRDAGESPGPAGRASPLSGILLMLAAMAMFATMDGVGKVAARDIPVWQILWFRYIVLALVTLAVVVPQGMARTLRSRRPWLQIVRPAILLIESGAFVLAFKLMPVADVHALAAVSPLLVVALSMPVLGEHVGPRRWLAVLVGFAGVLVIVRPGFAAIGWPTLLVIGAAFLWAFYQVLARLCARDDGSTTTWAWTALIGLLITSAIGPFVWVWPDAAGWMRLVVIAVLGAAAHVAVITALTRTPAADLQPYSYTLFVWAVVVGYVGFSHVPDGWTLAGAGIIITSGLYAWHRERVRAEEARRGSA